MSERRRPKADNPAPITFDKTSKRKCAALTLPPQKKFKTLAISEGDGLGPVVTEPGSCTIAVDAVVVGGQLAPTQAAARSRVAARIALVWSSRDHYVFTLLLNFDLCGFGFVFFAGHGFA